jgi:hypothetical protein
MKHKLALLLAVVLFAGAFVPATIQAAVGFSISIGDRPYYSHGPYYWDNGERWYWVPGHSVWRYHHRIWVHGYYVPRHHYYRYYR